MSASYLSSLYYIDFDGIVKRLSTSKNCTNLTFLEQKLECSKFKPFRIAIYILMSSANQSYFCASRQWYCTIAAATYCWRFEFFSVLFKIQYQRLVLFNLFRLREGYKVAKLNTSFFIC